MRTVKFPKASLSRRLIALAVAAAASLALFPAVEVEAARPPVKIAFKLDTRVTGGLYMGDRWVTPATFIQLQDGPKMIVSARSRNDVSWIPADPSMVSVTPSVGRLVNITVNRAGETTMTAGGVLLAIKAEQAADGVLKVQIKQ
jgi:hypothetical protein